MGADFTGELIDPFTREDAIPWIVLVRARSQHMCLTAAVVRVTLTGRLGLLGSIFIVAGHMWPDVETELHGLGLYWTVLMGKDEGGTKRVHAAVLGGRPEDALMPETSTSCAETPLIRTSLGARTKCHRCGLFTREFWPLNRSATLRPPCP